MAPVTIDSHNGVLDQAAEEFMLTTKVKEGLQDDEYQSRLLFT